MVDERLRAVEEYAQLRRVGVQGVDRLGRPADPLVVGEVVGAPGPAVPGEAARRAGDHQAHRAELARRQLAVAQVACAICAWPATVP
ncbi:MAG TPA: hypothetical protein VFP84_10920 [Kofleriaceae bacterium]|nr:hypothetical protein [Kofleriaceae bacterium]